MIPNYAKLHYLKISSEVLNINSTGHCMLGVHVHTVE